MTNADRHFRFTAGEVSSFCDMACSLSSVPLCQHLPLAGRGTAGPIPLADVLGFASKVYERPFADRAHLAAPTTVATSVRVLITNK